MITSCNNNLCRKRSPTKQIISNWRKCFKGNNKFLSQRLTWSCNSKLVLLENEWIQSLVLPSQGSWPFALTYPLMKTFCFLLICSKLLFPLFHIGSGLQQGCCELSIITLERGQFCLPMLADCRTAQREWEWSELPSLFLYAFQMSYIFF